MTYKPFEVGETVWLINTMSGARKATIVSKHTRTGHVRIEGSSEWWRQFGNACFRAGGSGYDMTQLVREGDPQLRDARVNMWRQSIRSAADHSSTEAVLASLRQLIEQGEKLK